MILIPAYFLVLVGIFLTFFGLLSWTVHDPPAPDALAQINSTLWFIVASLGLVVAGLGWLLAKPRG